MPRQTSEEIPGHFTVASQAQRPKLRASHTKSRHGCYNCKRRRVKCDEERPTCGTCLIRGYRCSYPSQTTASRQPRTGHEGRRGASQDGRGVEEADHGRGRSTSIQPLNFSVASTSERNSGSHLNLSDLRLLHHYFLYTSKRMSLNRGKCLTWERVIPDIATKNEFLMHLLLALSGLDDFTHQHPCNQDPQTAPPQKDSNESMRFTDVDSTSLQTVVEHHQQGLRGLRAALDGAIEANLEALATGSMLLSAFGFASLRLKDFDPSHADGDGRPRVDWLRLVRGAASIISGNWASLRAGRLRKLFIFDRLDGGELDTPLTSPTLIHSKRLSTFEEGARRAIFNLRTFSDDLNLAISNAGHQTDSADSPSCAHNERNFLEHMFEDHGRVIDVVEDKYMRILHVIHFSRVDSDASSDLDILADIEDTAVVSWPYLLPQTFVSSLDSYPYFGILEGKSFTILVHLYLILAIMENTWYIGTTIDREVKKINALVTTLGNPQLVKLMQWPMEVVSS